MQFWSILGWENPGVAHTSTQSVWHEEYILCLPERTRRRRSFNWLIWTARFWKDKWNVEKPHKVNFLKNYPSIYPYSKIHGHTHIGNIYQTINSSSQYTLKTWLLPIIAWLYRSSTRNDIYAKLWLQKENVWPQL